MGRLIPDRSKRGRDHAPAATRTRGARTTSPPTTTPVTRPLDRHHVDGGPLDDLRSDIRARPLSVIVSS